MKHIPVPGDGRCLFHSVSQHVKEPTWGILHKLFQFLKDYSHQKLRADEPETIADWIFMEHSVDTLTQIQKLQSGFWGGYLDLVILAQIQGRPIHVQNPWQSTLVIESNCPVCTRAGPITIYQNGDSHYNAIEV